MALMMKHREAHESWKVRGCFQSGYGTYKRLPRMVMLLFSVRLAAGDQQNNKHVSIYAICVQKGLLMFYHQLAVTCAYRGLIVGCKI